LNAEITVRHLFENPTVTTLEPLLRAGTARPPLVAGPRPDPLPLSYAQRRLWFMHRLEGPSATYNIPVVTRLRGELDVPALRAAVGDVVERHEILRTIYVEVEGEPTQRILPADAAGVPFTEHRLTEGELDGALAAAAAEPFDLGSEPPLRVRLYSIADDEHLLAICLHHIAGDGTSMT
ncbi:condensation domain-containing protein, partial [Pilimelia anulata]|uniref:condensation domain-containing protein n=1 Tax=Pilimelia anulata TaxID=53371 RepID=UPI0016643AA8